MCKFEDGHTYKAGYCKQMQTTCSACSMKLYDHASYTRVHGRAILDVPMKVVDRSDIHIRSPSNVEAEPRQ